MTQRSLDHFVVACADLDMAGEAYERLGFQVMPEMRHAELGTRNRVIQMNGTYVELIVDLDRAPPLLRPYLSPMMAFGDGLIMTSMTSDDLPADHAAMTAAGLAPKPIVNARRTVDMPDGTEAETDSHCFYIWRPENLFLNLFLSHHYRPEVIWIPEYMVHPNGVTRVSGITLIANPVADDVTLVSCVLGGDPEAATAGEARYVTPRGEQVRLLSGHRARDEFGELLRPAAFRLPGHAAAIDYQVVDLEACREVLRANGVSFVEQPGRIAPNVRVPGRISHIRAPGFPSPAGPPRRSRCRRSAPGPSARDDGGRPPPPGSRRSLPAYRRSRSPRAKAHGPPRRSHGAGRPSPRRCCRSPGARHRARPDHSRTRARQ